MWGKGLGQISVVVVGEAIRLDISGQCRGSSCEIFAQGEEFLGAVFSYLYPLSGCALCWACVTGWAWEYRVGVEIQRQSRRVRKGGRKKRMKEARGMHITDRKTLVKSDAGCIFGEGNSL